MTTGPAGTFILQQPEESFRKAMAKFLMQEAAAKRQIKPSTPMGMHLQGLAGLTDRALLEYDLKKERQDRREGTGIIADPKNQPPTQPATPSGRAQAAVPVANPPPRPPADIPRAAVPPSSSAAAVEPAEGRRSYADEWSGANPWRPGDSPDTRYPFPAADGPIMQQSVAVPATPTFMRGAAAPMGAGGSTQMPAAGQMPALERAPPRPARPAPADDAVWPPLDEPRPGPQSRAGDDPVRATAYASEGGGGDVSPAEEAAIRTIVAEAPSRDPEAMRAVAAVMANRARGSGGDLQAVVSRPRQFEGYGNRNYQDAAPGTPQFERAREATIRMLRGEDEDPTGGANHFVSPGGQETLGRNMPSWTRGQTPIGNFGGNQFYRLPTFPGARRDAAPVGDRQQTDTPVTPPSPGGGAQSFAPPPVGGYGGAAPVPPMQPPMQRPSMPPTGAPPTPPPMGPPQAGPAQMSPFRERFEGAPPPGPQSMGGPDGDIGGGPMAAIPFADPNGGMTGSMAASMPPGMQPDPDAVPMRGERDAIWPPPSPAGGAGPGPVLAQAQALQAPQGPPAPVPAPLPPGGRPSPATAGAGAVPGAPAAPPRAGVLAPPGDGGLMSPTPTYPPQAQAAPAPAPAGARPPASGRPPAAVDVDPSKYPGIIRSPDPSIQQFLGAPEARPNPGEVPGPVRRPMPEHVQRQYNQLIAAAKNGNDQAMDLALQLRAPYLVEHPYEIKDVDGKMYAFHPFTRKATEIAGGKDKPDITVDHGSFTARYDPYHKGLIGIASKNEEEVKRQQAVGTDKGKAQQELPAAVTKAQQALQQVEELRKHPGRQWATGPVFGQTTPFPGTSAAGFVTRFEQLKGSAFLQAYEALKGGGAITEPEGKKATEALNRMSRSTDAKEFDAALDDFAAVIRSGMENTRKRAGAAEPQGGGGGGGGQPPPSIGTIVNGYRYLGGSVRDRGNWQRVQ
jgi:hypothetical protein